ncbi:Haloacid dehalogenase, IA family protein [Candidatus Sulfopaludibacter sp. SbA3]|nr:Haloacid dehalogenase, IA family protein [Candidatus Sulfopaludibacter sp. SbA3]
MRAFAAILFDVDGTLLDDDQAVDAALVAFHSVYGDALGMSLANLTFRWRALLNIHFWRYLTGEISMQEQRRARVQDLFGSRLRTSADEIFAVYERCYRASWVAFPDVPAALSALNGFQLAVLTNGELSQQTQKLRAAGVEDRFSRIFASSEIGAAKPRPEAFLTACARLGFDPGRCVYVGDNLEVDALGSATAGLTGVWLDRHGSGIDPAGGIRVIRSLGELPDLIGRRQTTKDDRLSY